MARFAARAYDLPVTIARLNTVMGPHRAFFGKFLDAVRAERAIVLPGDPDTHTPIHSEDMIHQIAPLIDAAGRAPLIVNWCGDEVVISQQAIRRMAERLGVAVTVTARPSPGLAGGNISDPEKRRAITGPCRTGFADALERMMDEMMDGAPCPLAQRDWDYASAAQVVTFNGAQ